MINLSKKIYKSIKSHALHVTPEESCGLLIETKEGLITFPCENAAEDKLNNFSITPKDYIIGSNMGNIIAYYHSHTSENHSKDFTIIDKLNSVNHKLPIIMYNTIDDKFSIFDEKEVNYKYIGAKFEYNKNDCLSLVERYYNDEFNIKLPIYERNDQTIEKNPLLFIENIENYGFQELDKNIELKNGDIIITNSIKGPTHLMIYIGNNNILHHRFGSFSTVEIYNNFYKQNTHLILRHKSLWN